MSDGPDRAAGLPSDPAWAVEVYEAALARKHATGRCEACGEKRWGTSPELLLVSALDTSGRFVAGRGVDAVAVFCRRCGLLRLHAASVLLKD